MTDEEAILILDGASASAPLNRDSHVKVQDAVKVLKELVKKKQKDK